jgi:hypothetical protein
MCKENGKSKTIISYPHNFIIHKRILHSAACRRIHSGAACLNSGEVSLTFSINCGRAMRAYACLSSFGRKRVFICPQASSFARRASSFSVKQASIELKNQAHAMKPVPPCYASWHCKNIT